MIERVQVGDTREFRWVNSGTTPSSIIFSIFNGSETLVHSAAMVDSGNGHYYALARVDTPGFYVAQWLATVSGNPYKRRTPFNAILTEVD